jgi:hypothetical protein
LDGKSDFLALFFAIFLVGGRGPDGSIESDIGCFAFSGAGLNVTPPLTFGLGTRTTPSLPAGQPVDGGVEIAGDKGIPGFYFFAALPPVGIAGVEDILLGWFGRSLLLGLLVGEARGYLTGFFFSSASASSGAG